MCELGVVDDFGGFDIVYDGYLFIYENDVVGLVLECIDCVMVVVGEIGVIVEMYELVVGDGLVDGVVVDDEDVDGFLKFGGLFGFVE